MGGKKRGKPAPEMRLSICRRKCNALFSLQPAYSREWRENPQRWSHSFLACAVRIKILSCCPWHTGRMTQCTGRLGPVYTRPTGTFAVGFPGSGLDACEFSD